MNTLLGLVDSVRVHIRKVFADRGFSFKENVQGLADRGGASDKAAGECYAEGETEVSRMEKKRDRVLGTRV